MALFFPRLPTVPQVIGDSYPDDADAFANMYAGYVTLLVIVGATLFAGDAIVSEFQNRTGYLLFPKPVKRWVLLAGKFLASAGAMFLVLILYYATVLVMGLVVTGDFSVLGVKSLLLAMLYSVAAMSVGYLISSVMKGATGAQVLTFSLFLFIFNIVTRVLTLGDVEPWFAVTFAGEVVVDITLDPYPVDRTASGEGPLAVSSFVPDVGLSIAVMAAYAAASLMLTCFFFKRREMSS